MLWRSSPGPSDRPCRPGGARPARRTRLPSSRRPGPRASAAGPARARPGRDETRIHMAKYRIAWLPGDGIGVEVLEASRIVLDRLALDAEYVHGDIGWEFWRAEGDAFPQRTIDLLNSVDAAMFGAITSKPVKAAEAELPDGLRGKGRQYRSPIVRMRQLFDLYICLR